MVQEETRQLSLFLLFILVSIGQILIFIWTVVFIRYGDHLKYDLEVVVTLQLGFGIAFFFLTLIFGIVAVWNAVIRKVRDEIWKELEAERKKIITR